MNTPTVDRPVARLPAALAVGTRLHEYQITDVLGSGGFGIVYRAIDHELQREVAIKEYLPSSLAGRTQSLQVSIRSEADAATFALGLKSFVNEARLLARFDHPSLVKVYRFWEAHGTGYMVMPLYRGRTLRQIRQELPPGPPDESWMRMLLEPLLGAIECLHAEGVYHRDIAPDNIVIEADGRPVLLDFGAARRVIGEGSQHLTAIIKPAFAPIEQYAEAGAVRQGPWTDLYALGATLHYVLIGRAPAPATVRAVHDEGPRLAELPLPGLSRDFLAAVDWMIAPRPADRPRHVGELRAVLDRGRPASRLHPSSPDAWSPTQVLAVPAGAARAFTTAVHVPFPEPGHRSGTAPSVDSAVSAGPSGRTPEPGSTPDESDVAAPDSRGWSGDPMVRRRVPVAATLALALALAGGAIWGPEHGRDWVRGLSRLTGAGTWIVPGGPRTATVAERPGRLPPQAAGRATGSPG